MGSSADFLTVESLNKGCQELTEAEQEQLAALLRAASADAPAGESE
ncbi:hypothetical protein [Nonomuraea insulae]|uniref:Uncharacterized protein n=1 Tax=Nonomuraea insulae TaxID=1616787 RepID=A0ABW1D2U1_9ACTN